jgi:hypothetical protein
MFTETSEKEFYNSLEELEQNKMRDGEKVQKFIDNKIQFDYNIPKS